MVEKKKLIIAAVVAVVVIAVIIALSVGLQKSDDEKPATTAAPTPTPKKDPLKADLYKKAAVAADAKICSTIGKDMLSKGGHAVDAAVAAILCIGLVNFHSAGIGGGGFMNVYTKSEGKAKIYDFREVAPLSSTEKMFVNKSSKVSTTGGLAIAVPGEIKGLMRVHKDHGKLPWKDLVAPAIKIAREGYPMVGPASTSFRASSNFERVKADPGLKELLYINGKWAETGDIIKNEKLAKTLEKIAENPDDFYNGTIADSIVKDVNAAGGNFVKLDLSNFTVITRDPLEMQIDDMKFHLMPPPGSGAVVGMVMNILRGYKMSKDDLSTTEKTIQTTHKLVEAFKFAYARRALLGDPSFVPKENTTRVTGAMLNLTFGDQIRTERLTLNQTHENSSYYGGYYSQDLDPYGTSHLSILAENGDAVAATVTINTGFGAAVRSQTTGIIYNNEMDDFSTPGKPNYFGYEPTPANYIKPKKKPLSSMAPTIVTDKDGNVMMIAGASGGSRIITGTATVLVNKLYLEKELGHSVSDPRVHHQLLPNKISYNRNAPYTMAEDVRAGLEKLGHKVEPRGLLCVVQAIYRDKDGLIHAKSDPRKGKGADGY